MNPTTPDFETIDVTVGGPIGRLTLDRPAKLNPLSVTCLEELIAAAGWFDGHDEVKVVVVRGAGRAFTAGADLDMITDTSSRETADVGRLMAEAIEAMKAVTIAAVHGYCIGGGCVLVTACDLRVAAESARFSIPEVDIGIPLAWGGIPRLVREVGPAVTRDLVLSCRPFSPAEALTMGLVNRVVPDADLESAVDELADELAAKSAYTLRSVLLAVDAASEEMVSTGSAWNDADSLMSALRDPESREVGRRYLSARGRQV
jgi:enoyl-CoA hydratase/carnithine racemase